MHKRSRSFALVVLLSLAPVVTAHPSFAQGADPTLAAAHARFEEGVKFFDKGQYENARAAFLQAYALHKHPAVLMNLAQSSLRSGHTLEADRFFARYLKESASLTPAQRAEAEKGLTEARTKLGRIDVLAPAGTAVTIDGEIAGTDGSTTLDVEPGAHAVKGGVESMSVTVTAGQTVMVKLGAQAAPAVVPVPPPPPPVVVAEPVPPSEPVTQPTPAPTEHHSSIFSRPATMAPVYVGVAASVLGFASTVMFAVFKGNATDSYNGQVSAIKSAVGFNSAGACVNPKQQQLVAGCNALNNDASQVSADATGANVSATIGIVGAGFALGWYLFAPKADEKPSSALSHPYVQPLMGAHLQGLTVGASF